LKLDLEASVPAVKAASAKAARPPGRAAAAHRPASSTSWWTARATAGEVTAGFTKEEILRRPDVNPREENGLFARLEGLLAALS
jgi:hypothetical protein